MGLQNIKEIVPSESCYPVRDDKEFKELFNKKDSYFQVPNGIK